jgi:hypothetical protein
MEAIVPTLQYSITHLSEFCRRNIFHFTFMPLDGSVVAERPPRGRLFSPIEDWSAGRWSLVAARAKKGPYLVLDRLDQ